MIDVGCITDADGLDYRMIADVMTVAGTPMGHSTVRNVIMRVMERFAASLMAANGVVGDPAVVARSTVFQQLIAAYIQDIYFESMMMQ